MIFSLPVPHYSEEPVTEYDHPLVFSDHQSWSEWFIRVVKLRDVELFHLWRRSRFRCDQAKPVFQVLVLEVPL